MSIYVTVRCPSVCLSRRSIAAATCSWFAAPLARAEISIGGCGRRRSAANAGSFLLRVDKGVSSTQTCYTRYRQKPTRLQTEITAVCLTVGELPNSKQQGGASRRGDTGSGYHCRSNLLILLCADLLCNLSNVIDFSLLRRRLRGRSHG